MRSNDLTKKSSGAANLNAGGVQGSDADAISEDQLEVRKYLNSDVFWRTCQQIDLLNAGDDPAATTDSRSTTSLIHQDERAFPMSQSQSLFRALGFQAALLCLIAGMLPVTVGLLEWLDFLSSPKFASIALVSQTFAFPILTSFAFTVVSVSLWHASIIFRFAVAAVSCLAALGIFTGSLATVFFLDGQSQSMMEVLENIAAPLFCFFVVAMFFSLLVQLFTSWTLIEAKVSLDQVAKTGMRSMIELTAVSAFCCSFLTKIDFQDEIIQLVVFAFLGIISSVVAIFIIRHQLVRRCQGGSAGVKPWKRLLPVALALALAIIFNGMLAVQEFGNRINFVEGLLIFAVSTYGAALVYATGFVHAFLLKKCGWRFVSRKAGVS